MKKFMAPTLQSFRWDAVFVADPNETLLEEQAQILEDLNILTTKIELKKEKLDNFVLVDFSIPAKDTQYLKHMNNIITQQLFNVIQVHVKDNENNTLFTYFIQLRDKPLDWNITFDLEPNTLILHTKFEASYFNIV